MSREKNWVNRRLDIAAAAHKRVVEAMFGSTGDAVTVWVYAKDHDEALKNAAGKDGYGSWDSEAAAIRDGKKESCRRPGEELFSVTTARVTAPAGQKREQGESYASPAALDATPRAR